MNDSFDELRFRAHGRSAQELRSTHARLVQTSAPILHLRLPRIDLHRRTVRVVLPRDVRRRRAV